MDKQFTDELESFLQDLIFKGKYYQTDALALYSYVNDHRPCSVYVNKNGFLELRYCGRCSTVVQKGDQFCNQCGRRILNND